MNEDGPDDVIPIRADDPEMLDAINQARQSVDSFIHAFLNPKSNQKSFFC